MRTQEVGFNMAELLKERRELWGGDAAGSEGSDSDGDGHWVDSPPEEDAPPSEAQVRDAVEDAKLRAFKAHIVSGEPYTERKSSFQVRPVPVAWG